MMFWIVIAGIVFIISVLVAIYSMRSAATGQSGEEVDERLPPQPRVGHHDPGLSQQPVPTQPVKPEASPKAAASRKYDESENAFIAEQNIIIEQKKDDIIAQPKPLPKASEIKNIDELLAIIQHQAQVKQDQGDVKPVQAPPQSLYGVQNTKSPAAEEPPEGPKELGQLLGTIAIGKKGN